jgi:hypothetical protein
MQSAQQKAHWFAFGSSYTLMTSTAYFYLFMCVDWGHSGPIGRSSVLQSWWSRARSELFIDIILPTALWPCGRLSLYQKWVPGIFPGGEGGKGGQCVGLTTLSTSCAKCVDILEASVSWRRKGLSRPVMGELICVDWLTVGQSHIYITHCLYPTNLLNTVNKYEFTFIKPTKRIAIQYYV